MNVIEKYKEWISEKYGIKKPESATWDEWEEWHSNSKAAKPWVYFFYETIPSFFSKKWRRVTDKINDVKYWIRYRTVDRYHVIHTRLKPGYKEFDERCLHGCFELMVDYVECQLSWRSVIFDEDKKSKYPWWGKGIFRFTTARRPEYGIDTLKWESTLDSTSLPMHERSEYQAERARELLDLYHWWKYVRPLRKDPMDLSGWSAICDEREKNGEHFLSDKDANRRDKKRERLALDRTNEIEQAYDDEDTEQLIRLIKIRKGLWT